MVSTSSPVAANLHLTACAQPPEALSVGCCSGGSRVLSVAICHSSTRQVCSCQEAVKVQALRQHVQHATAHGIQGQALMRQRHVLKGLRTGRRAKMGMEGIVA